MVEENKERVFVRSVEVFPIPARYPVYPSGSHGEQYDFAPVLQEAWESRTVQGCLDGFKESVKRVRILQDLLPAEGSIPERQPFSLGEKYGFVGLNFLSNDVIGKRGLTQISIRLNGGFGPVDSQANDVSCTIAWIVYRRLPFSTSPGEPIPKFEYFVPT